MVLDHLTDRIVVTSYYSLTYLFIYSFIPSHILLEGSSLHVEGFHLTYDGGLREEEVSVPVYRLARSSKGRTIIYVEQPRYLLIVVPGISLLNRIRVIDSFNYSVFRSSRRRQ